MDPGGVFFSVYHEEELHPEEFSLVLGVLCHCVATYPEARVAFNYPHSRFATFFQFYFVLFDVR